MTAELKPLGRALQDTTPARERLATTRNRVLRGVGVTRAAKRTQEAQPPRDRASKAPSLGARALC